MEVLLASFLEAFSTHSRPTRKSVAVMWVLHLAVAVHPVHIVAQVERPDGGVLVGPQLVAMAGASLP